MILEKIDLGEVREIDYHCVRCQQTVVIRVMKTGFDELGFGFIGLVVEEKQKVPLKEAFKHYMSGGKNEVQNNVSKEI